MKARIQIHKLNGPAKVPLRKINWRPDTWHEDQIREHFASIETQVAKIHGSVLALNNCMLHLTTNWQILKASKDGKGKPCKR